MNDGKQDLLLYDDSCPMCTFQTRGLTWLDWRHVIRLMPISHPRSIEVAGSLDRQSLREAIHCVRPDGTLSSQYELRNGTGSRSEWIFRTIISLLSF